VVNATETSATFQTTITCVQVLHDLSKQESADAIMGYYNADQLPAYDLLAREFLTYDRWFASLPTDTFPNRLYALTGDSGGMRSSSFSFTRYCFLGIMSLLFLEEHYPKLAYLSTF
jgi:hypothetical protein